MSTQNRVESDAALSERAWELWSLGDWDALAGIGLEEAEQDPRRGELEILVLAAHIQVGSGIAAKELFAAIRRKAADRATLVKVLVAGVHNSLGRAESLIGNVHPALRHFEDAVNVRSFPERHAVSAGRSYLQLGQLGLLSTKAGVVAEARRPAPSRSLCALVGIEVLGRQVVAGPWARNTHMPRARAGGPANAESIPIHALATVEADGKICISRLKGRFGRETAALPQESCESLAPVQQIFVGVDGDERLHVVTVDAAGSAIDRRSAGSSDTAGWGTGQAIFDGPDRGACGASGLAGSREGGLGVAEA